ncbi:TPA: hypothetical protein N0F65_004960 [Lagenidium giganteum]|uniref:Uncharacterized protein n=1 Tax=Lagenidium giganteum TaxID=4803 RepID=A0AAV2YK88_9STRA|nr:TPA: hypothetical protein N0F65_004960 [Lagenidium giganteum]
MEGQLDTAVISNVSVIVRLPLTLMSG